MKREKKTFLLLALCIVMLVAAGCHRTSGQSPQTDNGLTGDDLAAETPAGTTSELPETTGTPETTGVPETTGIPETTGTPETTGPPETTESPAQDEQIPENTETGWGPIHW